jgi:hypothetical protein
MYTKCIRVRVADTNAICEQCPEMKKGKADRKKIKTGKKE